MPRNLVPLLRHTLTSMRQNRVRSFVSAMGIACGVVSFLVMMGVAAGAKKQTLEQIESLGLKNVLIKKAMLSPEQNINARRRGSPGLSVIDGDRIKRLVRVVEEVAAVKEIKANVYTKGRELSPQIIATSSSYQFVQDLGLARGRFILDNDVRDHSLVCVVGSETAREMTDDGSAESFVRVENAIYRVVGVLRPSAKKSEKGNAISSRDLDHALILPLWDHASGMGNESSELSELIVKFRSGSDVLSSVPLIGRYMEIAHHGADDYSIVVPQELLRQAREARGTFDILLGSISLISLLVGGIGIMNIMLAKIAERTHEIGIRRAMGATGGHVFIQFLTEAMVLSVTGGLIGLFLGLSGLWGGSLFAGWKVWITFQSLLVPLFLSIFMGLIFGVYPAVKASKMDPITALSL